MTLAPHRVCACVRLVTLGHDTGTPRARVPRVRAGHLRPARTTVDGKPRTGQRRTVPRGPLAASKRRGLREGRLGRRESHSGATSRHWQCYNLAHSHLRDSLSSPVDAPLLAFQYSGYSSPSLSAPREEICEIQSAFPALQRSSFIDVSGDTMAR